jgi:hypothetical protein
MNKQEQAQLAKHDVSVGKLEKLVTLLIRRSTILEKENARLKHALVRVQNSISSLEHRLK